MPGESVDPKLRKDNNNSTLDLNQSLMKSHKLPKRELKKGKWVKVIEEPTEVLIQRYQQELAQGNEVIMKLKQQKEKLDQQVVEVTKMVQEKVNEAKEDEKKRIEKTKEYIHHPNRRQVDLNIKKLTPQEIDLRLEELEREMKNTRKQERVLTKELEKTKNENEDRKILDQISNLELGIKKADADMIKMQAEIKNMDKVRKDNERKIESIQSDKDDAQKINRLTQEVYQMKEKVKAAQEKKMKDEQNYNNIDKLIEAINTKYEAYYKAYKERCAKDKVEPTIVHVPLKQDYHKIKLEDEIKLKKMTKEERKAYKLKELEKIPPEEKKKKEEEKQKKKEEKKKKELEEYEKRLKEEKERRQKQLVKEIRKDQDDFDALTPSVENYLRLHYTLENLKKARNSQMKTQAKEIKSLEERLNEIQFEISATYQSTKEKEKEKELADNKFVELKKHVKKGQLESLEKPKPELNGLEKKKKQLENDKEKLQKYQEERGLYPKLPFSTRDFKYTKSAKKLDKSIVEEETPLSKLLDCQFRLAVRHLLGLKPNNDTKICDDVNVVGTLSIEHRIRKILFYHDSEKGLIYGFQTEYVREDKKTSVSGQWQINEVMKNDKETKQSTLTMKDNDWINIVTGQQSDKYITYLKIQTKRGEVAFEVGKFNEEAKPEHQFTFQRTKGEIPITLFGGFSQLGDKVEEGQEQPLALSCIGFESAEKMRIEEKIYIEEEKRLKRELKERKAREDKLNESKARLPGLGLELSTDPPKDSQKKDDKDPKK